LLATKTDVNELFASTSVAYALVCKDALISIQDMQQMSTKLILFLVHLCQIVLHIGQIRRKQKKFIDKFKNYSTKVTCVSLLVRVLFRLFFSGTLCLLDPAPGEGE
jgi:hypothetical protein